LLSCSRSVPAHGKLAENPINRKSTCREKIRDHLEKWGKFI
jgi:hypothetical protein